MARRAPISQIAAHDIIAGKSLPKHARQYMRAPESTAASGRLAQFLPGSGLDAGRAVLATETDRPFLESGSTGAGPAAISFGPFCLLPRQFLLREGGTPVALGSRALEILIALLERRGQLVSKQDLMARVWPNVFVEPANLTVHMSALRRVLRDGKDGNRFIINIPGRGYCFVGSVDMSGHEN
jgi:DNA-binding winged helix-turn-helix (wHTH) protein